MGGPRTTEDDTYVRPGRGQATTLSGRGHMGRGTHELRGAWIMHVNAWRMVQEVPWKGVRMS